MNRGAFKLINMPITSDEVMAKQLWKPRPIHLGWASCNRLKLRVGLMVIPKHLAAMDAAVMVSSPHRSANGTRSPVPPVRGFFIAVHHVCAAY